ncbi:MAG: hypothetical protein K8L97_24280 [Anaerolineae bacterium]|nr:hypothetical protein [Anaerolineae bacterium]
MYMPAIIDARHVRSYQVGPYLTMLFTDCKSAGQIQYRHVLFVYAPPDPRDPRPKPPSRIMAVAAERNPHLERVPDVPRNGYFLGVFPGEGHMNMGMSEDWYDLEKFAQKALEIVANQYMITIPPQLLPPIPPKRRWWQFWRKPSSAL